MISYLIYRPATDAFTSLQIFIFFAFSLDVAVKQQSHITII